MFFLCVGELCSLAFAHVAVLLLRWPAQHGLAKQRWDPTLCI